MLRPRTLPIIVLGLALTLSAPLVAAAQNMDAFYADLLREGTFAYQNQDFRRASEELRIAAFGLLDEPNELASALGYLALAQQQLADEEGLERTLRRLDELERRFGAISASRLSPDALAALRTAMGVEPIPPAPVTPTVPMAPLPAAAEPQATSVESPQPRTRTELCISWDGGDCRRPAHLPVAPGAAADATAQVDQPSEADVAALSSLRSLATQKAKDKQLAKGFVTARELANRFPTWSEAHQVAAVLASRAQLYPEAVTYYESAGMIGADRPVELFYLSVALFETNQFEEAAAALRKALPTLQQTREVRKYIKQILPDGTPG